ncbi:MAG: AlbA family DNA-binding domain-containing protein [Tannerellaceae bacterium]
MPEIKFITHEDKHLIQVTVFRGSTPPYYLKDKGKLQGTYFRVGSTNRVADEPLITELERRKRNISYDSEITQDKVANTISINTFKEIFKEKTGEEINAHTLRKVDLIKELQGVEYPTNALVLFSDDTLRNSMFHYAKVECARFKGISSEEFIDQKRLAIGKLKNRLTDTAYLCILYFIDISETNYIILTCNTQKYRSVL